MLFGQYDTELIREIIRLSTASVVLIDAGDHCLRHLSFVRKYVNEKDDPMNPTMIGAMENAINYFHDFLESKLVFKQPSTDEKIPLVELTKKLEGLNDKWDASELQQIILDVGKTNGFENNRDWFKLIYEVLLGSHSGPRLGSFFALLGKEKTVEKLNEVLQ